MTDTESRVAPSLPARRRGETPLSVVSEGDVLVGNLEMSGNGRVMGSLEGQLICAGELRIGPTAKVVADIRARDLILAGHLRGNVVVQGQLEIASTGRLEGDAQAGSLVVQQGGIHFGLLHVYPEGLPAVAEAQPPGEPVPPALPAPRAPSLGARISRFWREIF